MSNRFDLEAASWDANEPRRMLSQGVAEVMLRSLELESGHELLDFGAGTGLVALRLRPYVRRVFAFDTSEGMLSSLKEKLARSQYTNVEVLMGSPSGMPTLPNVDVIVSSMTLHHIADIAALARTFRAALRPGGQIAVADLDPEGGLFHGKQADVMHDGFERDELGRIFSDAGFVGVKFEDAYRLERPIADGTTRSFMIFLMTACRGD